MVCVKCTLPIHYTVHGLYRSVVLALWGPNVLLLICYVVCMPCSHCCHAAHCTYGSGDTMLGQGTLPSFLFTLYSHTIFSIRVTQHAQAHYLYMHTHFYNSLALFIHSVVLHLCITSQIQRLKAAPIFPVDLPQLKWELT